MRPSPLSLEAIDAQEERFAAAFASGDMTTARPLYRPDVVYISPTTRLFGWPARIEGLEQALEFIQLTIAGLSDISYTVDQRALIPDDSAAYVRVQFEFNMGAVRLRSTYVVVYRYRDALIARQELYYDPSGQLEVLPSS
ncbi:MAG TPA: nuclear transport factor 2 family protein [Acidimicrobiales bacterium]|nr:nuclear transport factor 2 family protein [Acidimicrobiales bacterium]